MTKHPIRYLLRLASLLLVFGCGGTPPKQLPEPLQTAKSHEYKAAINYQQGRYKSAIRQFTFALSIYRAIDNLDKQAHIHINLIQTALLINNTDLANTHLNALSELIEFGQLAQLSSRHQFLKCDYLLKTNQNDHAFNCLNKLLAENFNRSDQSIQHVAKINLAIASIRLEMPEAANFLAQAKQQNNDSPLLKARFLRLKAALTKKKQNYSAAELSYSTALQYYQEALFQPGIAATLTELAELNILQQNTEKARHQLNRALAIRLHISDFHSADKLLSKLINLEQTQGNQDAVSQYQIQKNRLKTAINSR